MFSLATIQRINNVHCAAVQRQADDANTRCSDTAWLAGARYIATRNQFKLAGRYYRNTPAGRELLDAAAEEINAERRRTVAIKSRRARHVPFARVG